MLQNFGSDEAVDLVSPYTDSQGFTNKITTRNSTFLHFALIPFVMGQNLTPKATVRILVPVISLLGLELPQLINFLLATCTKTVDNHPPVTVHDKSEVGFEHQLQRLFKVDNSRKLNIFYKQLTALQPGGPDLGHAVSMQNIMESLEEVRVAFVNNMNHRCIDIETRNSPTTFGERYSHFFDRVLKLCDVEREEDLPAI